MTETGEGQAGPKKKKEKIGKYWDGEGLGKKIPGTRSGITEKENKN